MSEHIPPHQSLSANGEHEHQHHGFRDPAAMALTLDAPERDVWQKPDEVIASFGLAANATVAEIGAGTGYFAVRLAQHLPAGTVIGFDVQPGIVAYLQDRAIALGLENLDARLIDYPETCPLTEQLDLLLCVDTYHHIDNRIAMFGDLAKFLKPNGKLVIIDRTVEAADGPPVEMRVSPETVVSELASAVYSWKAAMDFLLPVQYYLTFTAGSRPG